MKKLTEFQTTYTKKGKYRRKCYVCGKLINNDEKVLMQKFEIEKYYPIKGIMRFIKWKTKHINCLIK